MNEIKSKYIGTHEDLSKLERGDVIATDRGYRMCVETVRDIKAKDSKIGLACRREISCVMVTEIRRYTIKDLELIGGIILISRVESKPGKYDQNRALDGLMLAGL